MVFSSDTDRDWKEWGATDPYFAVLADPIFRKQQLDDKTLEVFFESGSRHVEHVLDVSRLRLQHASGPGKVLDYGCGVGRVVVPFAKVASHVTGVDISGHMLEEAAKNSDHFGVKNVEFLLADKLKSLPPESFDLVHSHIVFMHIRPRRGYSILEVLLEKLKVGGIGAIHLTYATTMHPLRRLVRGVRERSRTVNGVIRLLQGKRYSEPTMQINSYSLNRVLLLLQAAGCDSYFVELSSELGFHGATLYFEKTRRSGS